MNIELVKMRSNKIQFLIIIHDLCLAIWINEEEFMKAAFWTKLNNRRRTVLKPVGSEEGRMVETRSPVLTN